MESQDFVDLFKSNFDKITSLYANKMKALGVECTAIKFRADFVKEKYDTCLKIFNYKFNAGLQYLMMSLDIDKATHIDDMTFVEQGHYYRVFYKQSDDGILLETHIGRVEIGQLNTVTIKTSFEDFKEQIGGLSGL